MTDKQTIYVVRDLYKDTSPFYVGTIYIKAIETAFLKSKKLYCGEQVTIQIEKWIEGEFIETLLEVEE